MDCATLQSKESSSGSRSTRDRSRWKAGCDWLSMPSLCRGKKCLHVIFFLSILATTSHFQLKRQPGHLHYVLPSLPHPLCGSTPVGHHILRIRALQILFGFLLSSCPATEVLLRRKGCLLYHRSWRKSHLPIAVRLFSQEQQQDSLHATTDLSSMISSSCLCTHICSGHNNIRGGRSCLQFTKPLSKNLMRKVLITR